MSEIKPKISIIIPCYNLGDYLDGCLRSIQHQDQTAPVEYIFIDDGSTDGTTDTLKAFCKSRSNTKLIIQPNQGVSQARNNGLQVSAGEYIYLLDGDDQLTSKSITTMLNAIIDSPDIIISPLKRFRNGNLYDFPFNLPEGTYNLPTLANYFSFFPIAPQPLYKREILTKYKIRFNSTIAVGEVLEFTFRFLVHSQTIKVINQPLFIYVLRSTGSATQNCNFEKDLSILKSIEAYKISLGEWYHHHFFQVSIIKLLLAFTYNKYAKLRLKGKGVKNALSSIKSDLNVRTILRKNIKDSKVPLRERAMAAYFYTTGYRGYTLLVSLLNLK